MRTVTFSNPKVAERVNERFIPVWYNRGVGFHNCSFWSEKNIFAHDADSYPTKNICTFFLTPDRRVAYYVAGYYSPEIFLQILEVADGLRKSATPAQQNKAHRALQATLNARASKAGKTAGPDIGRFAGESTFSYADRKHVHSDACARVVADSLSYRARVHGWLATKGSAALSDVQHDYLFGNSFTEEADPSRNVPTLAQPQAPVIQGVATQGQD